MASTSRPRPVPCPVLAITLLAACVPEVAPDPGALTAAPEPGSTGSTGDGEGESPTTGPLVGPPEDASTGTTGDEPGASDSTDPTATGTDGEPTPAECPYDPPDVAVTLGRTTAGVFADLSTRPCGAAEDLPALAVVAAADDHLELAVCADAACGACDPADVLALDLAIPRPFAGLPKQLAPGACLRLVAAWDRPGDGEPAACGVSSLALVRRDGGVEEPVPRFMYRHSEALPASDTVGSFTLAGEPAGPGAIACPCDDDCCGEPPGSRRVRFTAAREQWAVEVPPIHPGDEVPAFALGTLEGDDLMATVGLVAAVVPAACAAPARFEWILRLAP